ncbi:MFS transporter [Vibrio splendidus]
MYSSSSRFLLLNTLLIAVATFMVNPYLVVGAQDTLNISYSNIGLYLMVALVIGSVTSLAIGFLSPRKALLNILLTSSAGSVFSFLLMSCSADSAESSQLIFLIGLVLLRVCMSCATMITRTIHIMTNADKDCSKLFASAVSVFGVGSAIAPLIGGFIFETMGFVQLLLGAMGFMFLSLLVLGCAAFFIRTDLNSQTSIDEKPSSVTSYCVMDNWQLMVGCVLFFCLMGQSFSYIPVQINQLGESEWIAVFFGVNAAVLATLSIPISNWLKRRGGSALHYCILGLNVLTASLVIIPIAFSSLIGVVVVAALYSFGEILFSAYSLEVLRGKVKAEHISKAVSMYTFLTTSVGLGLGQYLGVLLLDNVSIYFVSATWIVICAVGYLLLKRTNNEENSTAVSA